MDNREIEKRIHAAVCSATPDKLDDIMKACGIGEQTEQQPEGKLTFTVKKKAAARKKNSIFKTQKEKTCI